MACISSVCIPQEVVDKILGYLWQDLPSLKAASLTCQSFASPCQRQLFSTIEIGRRFEHHRPSAQLLLPLVTSSPHVAEYVRSLIVEEKHTDVYLPQCLPFFHHLRLIHLSLYHLPQRDQVPGPLLSALAHVLQSPSLEFVEFRYSHPHSLYSGTSFKHLSLWWPVETPDPISLNTSRRNVLESLVIFIPRALQETVDTILCSSTIDISKLRRLHIHLHYADIVKKENVHIQRILSVCADTLEEFLFKLPMNKTSKDQAISAFSYRLDFGILKSLRRLHFYADPRYQSPLPFPWLLAVLGTISPLNRIEEITITLSVAVFYPHRDNIAHYVHIPWPQLAALFISNFQHLRRVILLVQMRSSDVKTLEDGRLLIQEQVHASHPDGATLVQSGLLEIANVDEHINLKDPRSFYRRFLLHDYYQW
ncbi:hypothetical protein B0H34DRAFT_811690 [Crassisporium funariophilum]|nr:hypothetical protein B0H34DRAFT_811690 [Crassisporium funariophilum]